jgi:hypothetical protein
MRATASLNVMVMSSQGACPPSPGHTAAAAAAAAIVCHYRCCLYMPCCVHCKRHAGTCGVAHPQVMPQLLHMVW